MDWELTLSEDQLKDADAYEEQVNQEVAARIGAEKTVPEIPMNEGRSHRLGFRAQRAFCAMMHLPWSPRDARRGRPNVGDIYRIKSRLRYAGNPTPDLKILGSDWDSLVFVAMSTTDGIKFRADGWIHGKDAKQAPLRDYGNYGAKAHCTPMHALRSMDDIPRDPSIAIKKPLQQEDGDAQKVA